MSERVDVLEIDLSDVQSEAQETGQTLKELRAEVKELRNALENTEIGTEEFSNALTDLTKKQQELTNVTKSGVAAQKGSYNDLVNQMAILKASWKATADEGERNALGSQILEINTKLKEMDATIGNHQRNVGNYRQELKQLKETLATLEEGTEEYNQTLAKAANISQKLKDINEFVDRSAQDLGDHMQNVAGVAAGMSGALQTVQGILNLVGVESENVVKVMQTMQSVMAITQGLTALEGSIDAYKRLNATILASTTVQKLFNASKTAGAAASTADAAASTADAAAKGAQTTATTAATTAQWSLNAAMAANPLGVILAAIVAVVAAIYGLVSAIGSFVDDSEDMQKSNEALEASIAAVNKETERQVDLMRAEGATTAEVLAYQKQRIQGNIEEAKSNLMRLKSQADKGWWDWVTDGEQEQIDKAASLLKGLEEELDEINHRIEVDNRQTNRKKQEERERALAKEREDAKKHNEELKRIYAERAKIEEDVLRRTKEWSKQLSNATGGVWAQEAKRRKTELEKAKSDAVKSIEDSFKGVTGMSIAEAQKVADYLNELVKTNGGYTEQQFNEFIKKNYNITNLTLDQFNSINDKLIEEKKLVDDYYNQLAEKSADELKVNRLREEASLDESLETWGNYYDQNLISLEQYSQATGALLDQFENGVNSTNEKILLDAEAAVKKAEEVRRGVMEEWYNKRDQSLFEFDVKISEAEDKGWDVEANKLKQEQLQAEIDLIEKQKEAYINLGMSVKGLENDYMAAAAAQDQLAREEVSLKLNAIADATGVAVEAMSQIIGIGDGLSSKWADALGSIQDGLVNVGESIKSGEKGWQKYGQMAVASLNAASNIMMALADQQDATTEDGFEKQKKLQIAAATMSMLAGVVNCWMSAMSASNAWMTIWGQVAAGAATSAMVIATGIMQIQQIKNQTLESAGGNPPVPSMTAINAMGSPVSATTNIEGASTEGQVTDTKVYVLESDITNTQNNVKATVDEATF